MECVLYPALNNDFDIYEERLREWEMNAKKWVNFGCFSGVMEDMKSFVNKKSIIVDDQVFLIENTHSDLEKSQVFHSNSKKVSFSSSKKEVSSQKSKLAMIYI